MTGLVNRPDESPPIRSISPSDVHIWHASLEQPEEVVGELSGILSADEKERSDRFHFDRHRRSFIAGRGILRHLLSLYTGLEPGQVEIQYAQNGKPFLPGMDGPSGIRFNLSHSGGIAVYAFCRGREVGLDIELQRPLEELDSIAKRNFSGREYATLGSLPEQDRLEAFYLCWTRKEAFIKAIGQGISFPLQQFDVSLTPGEPAQLQTVYGSQETARRWSMLDLTIADGYAAALVIEGSGYTLTQHSWEDFENIQEK